MLHLQEKLKNQVIPEMMKKFGYRNSMAVPKIEKVVVNTGFGSRISNKTSKEKEGVYKNILKDLSLITGQYPSLTRAKKSISGFKIREGMPVGAQITLRGKKMYDFLERVIHIALPRSRDFQGLSPKSVDRRGNLTFAIREHIAFPEIEAEKAKNIFGLEITVVTSAENKEEGLQLFKLLGFPIKIEQP
jgi:large subunit ribosomal protein L5